MKPLVVTEMAAGVPSAPKVRVEDVTVEVLPVEPLILMVASVITPVPAVTLEVSAATAMLVALLKVSSSTMAVVPKVVNFAVSVRPALMAPAASVTACEVPSLTRVMVSARVPAT